MICYVMLNRMPVTNILSCDGFKCPLHKSARNQPAKIVTQLRPLKKGRGANASPLCQYEAQKQIIGKCRISGVGRLVI